MTFPFLSILTAPNETFNSLLRFLCWWHVHLHAANRYQILIKYPWKNNMFSFRGISSCFSCRNFQTSAFEVRSPSLYGPNPHSYWLNLNLPWWHLNSWCFFHVRSIFPGQHMLDSRFFHWQSFTSYWSSIILSSHEIAMTKISPVSLRAVALRRCNVRGTCWWP